LRPGLAVVLEEAVQPRAPMGSLGGRIASAMTASLAARDADGGTAGAAPPSD
jgi:hypothetical protein